MRRRHRLPRNRRGHRLNRIYLFRFRRQFTVDFASKTDPQKWASDFFTFNLNDFIGQEGIPAAWPFEDYRINLAKVVLRPEGVTTTIARGWGYTVPVQDARVKDLKLQDQTQDPLANWDGARAWNLIRGFKRLVRPKPQLTISDMTASNFSASMWLNSSRSGWLPLQMPAGTQRDGTRVVHYGLAFSYPSPGQALRYIVEITIYVTFRQFAQIMLKKSEEDLSKFGDCLTITDNEKDIDWNVVGSL